MLLWIDISTHLCSEFGSEPIVLQSDVTFKFCLEVKMRIQFGFKP